MIRLIRAQERHYINTGWLKSHWLFSFSNYYDPDNIQFGDLRIFNDDIVQPKQGFPNHPHSNMEIVTIVLDGEITHHDSKGNKSVIGTNEVHRTSAGKGIRHSELNFSEKSAHYYQIWIYPKSFNAEPSFEQIKYKPKKWLNKIFPVASGQGYENTVNMDADATIFRCELEAKKTLFYDIFDHRRIFIYITSGMVNINNMVFKTNDQARIDLENELVIKADKKTSFILIDLPSCSGWGYSEKILQGVNLK